MSADSTGARKKLAHMLLVCVALSAVGVLTLASTSFATNRQSPQIVTRAVTFDIPATNPPRILWILKLFNRSSLVGSDAGTSGVLIVPVPRTVEGTVQADVFRNGHWFSGSRMQVRGQGGTGTGGKGPGGKGGTGSHGGGKKKHPGTGGTGTGGSTGTHGQTGNGSAGTPGSTATGGSSNTGGSSSNIGGSTNSSGSTTSGASGSGALGGGASAGHSAFAPRGSESHGPAMAAAYASDPVTTSELSLTGDGSGFWSTSMGGLGLVLLGAYFVVRRRPRRTSPPPSYRSLVRDFYGD